MPLILVIAREASARASSSWGHHGIFDPMLGERELLWHSLGTGVAVQSPPTSLLIIKKFFDDQKWADHATSRQSLAGQPLQAKTNQILWEIAKSFLQP